MYKFVFLIPFYFCISGCSSSKPMLASQTQEELNLIVPPEIDLLPETSNLDIPENAASIFND